jgi:hypothetical protein
LRRLAFKMRLQIVPAAKMRLIPIRELPFALGAFPQGPFRAPFHSALCVYSVQPSSCSAHVHI